MSRYSLQYFIIYLHSILNIIDWNYFSVNGSNILGVFVSAHKSHLLVYLAIAKILHERGHNVTFVTSTQYDRFITDKLGNHSGVKLISVSTNTAFVSRTSWSSADSRIELILQDVERNSQFLEGADWRLFVAEQKTRNISYDLMLLGYFFNDYQLGIAAEFNCPIGIIWTAQPIGLVHKLIGNPEGRSYITQPYDKQQRIGGKAFLFALYENYVDFLILQRMKTLYQKYFPTSQYASFDDIRKNVSVVLCNHHSISEGPISAYTPAIIDVGGVQNVPFSKWNNFPKALFTAPENDWIFISFGTRFTWQSASEDLKYAFQSTLEQLRNYTIIWATGGDSCKDLLAGLLSPAHVYCAAWWPQNVILSQVNTKLFVTHGGKGSLSEALYHGVPIIGFPMFSDQWVNINRAVVRGFGLQLHMKNITSTGLMSAIRRVLSNESYAANVKRASGLYRDRPLSVNESVIYWLEYVMRYKGARHMRSPLADMSFWQRYSIDLYLFLFGCFLLSAYILHLLEQMLGN